MSGGERRLSTKYQGVWTPRGSVTPASSFDFRFIPVPLSHESFAQGGLTTADIRENRINVKIEFRRQQFADAIDFRDDGIFPHAATLP